MRLISVGQRLCNGELETPLTRTSWSCVNVPDLYSPQVPIIISFSPCLIMAWPQEIGIVQNRSVIQVWSFLRKSYFRSRTRKHKRSFIRGKKLWRWSQQNMESTWDISCSNCVPLLWILPEDNISILLCVTPAYYVIYFHSFFAYLWSPSECIDLTHLCRRHCY